MHVNTALAIVLVQAHGVCAPESSSCFSILGVDIILLYVHCTRDDPFNSSYILSNYPLLNWVRRVNC